MIVALVFLAILTAMAGVFIPEYHVCSVLCLCSTFILHEMRKGRGDK